MYSKFMSLYNIMKFDNYLIIFIIIFTLKYFFSFVFSKHSTFEYMKNVYNYGEPGSTENPNSSPLMSSPYNVSPTWVKLLLTFS